MNFTDQNQTLSYIDNTMMASNATLGELLDCPVYTREDDEFLDNILFWVEGVLQCCMAFMGLIGNIISAIILSREEMRNSFNLLLIALICFDSWYLFGSILESFRRIFHLDTELHTLLFPYILYPLQFISMAGSIFMTVGISLERYIAVHYPIDYNQSMNSPEACRRRLMKYVFPVIFLSFLFNIPKFLEARIGYELTGPTNQSRVIEVNHGMYNGSVAVFIDGSYYKLEHGQGVNHTVDQLKELFEVPVVEVTELRREPAYAIYYNNWTRLLILGIIPAIMLVYLNYKIYKDIKLRQSRRRQSMSQVTINHQARRRHEDNLAVVFMGIVLVFLVTHSLRILLNLHEMIVIRDAMECSRAGQRSFPLWSIVTAVFSHFLLVLNSSINMVIYCKLNPAFRILFFDLLYKTCHGIAPCFFNDEDGQGASNQNGHSEGQTATTATHHTTAKSAPPPTTKARPVELTVLTECHSNKLASNNVNVKEKNWDQRSVELLPSKGPPSSIGGSSGPNPIFKSTANENEAKKDGEPVGDVNESPAQDSNSIGAQKNGVNVTHL